MNGRDMTWDKPKHYLGNWNRADSRTEKIFDDRARGSHVVKGEDDLSVTWCDVGSYKA